MFEKFKKFCKPTIIVEEDFFVNKLNNKEIKELISQLSLFYYIKNHNAYIEYTGKNQYILTNDTTYGKVRIPIYSTKVLNYLRNIYQIKEIQIDAYPEIDVTILGKVIIGELLENASKQS